MRGHSNICFQFTSCSKISPSTIIERIPTEWVWNLTRIDKHLRSSQALFKGYCVGNKYAFEIRDE